MDSSGASAYVYAKASGMLAKSFVGERAGKIFSARTLRELYGMLFSNESPSVPESLLAKEIESLAEKKFFGEYIDLVKNYSNPAKILIALLHFYDYDNVKMLGAALSLGETELPEISDIGPYSLMHYEKWPNLSKITAKSPVSWYTEANDISEQYVTDSKIDAAYIAELRDALSELPADEREGVSSLIAREISFKNILWVLRLKVYYKMTPDEIRERLVFADKSSGRRDLFAREAIKVLEKDAESWDDWKDWKYAPMLNPHEDGVVWGVDPTWAEKSFRKELNKAALRSFHKNPMSVTSLVSWFKIKQNELDCIRTVAEGLRLDVEQEALRAAAGLEKD